MLKIFIGYDHRQPVAYNVLQHSIIRHASQPVSIIPLVLEQLPIKRQGLTPFTYSRFLVPYLCDYRGWALFLDCDIIVQEDIVKLFEHANDKYAVLVSKNSKRFEWASVMLFNCPKCNVLTPDYVEEAQNLHTIEWVPENMIGDLPSDWNHLVGYDAPCEKPKLIHYTQGNPCYSETIDSEHSQEWHEEHRIINSTVPWFELMGSSVHAVHVKQPDGQTICMPVYKYNQLIQGMQNSQSANVDNTQDNCSECNNSNLCEVHDGDITNDEVKSS